MVFPDGTHKLILRRPEGSDLGASADQIRGIVGVPTAAEQTAQKMAWRAEVKEAEAAGEEAEAAGEEAEAAGEEAEAAGGPSSEEAAAELEALREKRALEMAAREIA